MGMERRKLLKAMALSAGGALLPGSMAFASPVAQIRDIRLWTAPDHTRVVLDLTEPAEHTLFRLPNPNRVVLDVMNSRLSPQAARLDFEDPVVRNFRTGAPRPGVTRAVFELKEEARPRSFFLPASGDKGPRLVVDLYRTRVLDEQNETGAPSQGQRNRDSVIVIDPGHGGEDPGAVGPTGAREKDIALSVARKLAARINRTPGYKAHLTRTGDYYVSLSKRVAVARRHSPDLFLSLHADAFRMRSVRGASVYCLSERGKPSPDAAINTLVRRENSADLIGGVKLNEDFSPEVAEMLMDLSQRDSINRALVLGQNILGSLRAEPRIRLHFRTVKQAGFAVLKAPDVPSVLVEMAFLTNPGEERMIQNAAYQNTLAKALFNGAQRYVQASLQHGRNHSG